MTLSGGVGVQMSDAADRHGLDVASMPEAVQRELKTLLPYAAVANPVDTTAQALNDMDLMARNLEIILEPAITTRCPASSPPSRPPALCPGRCGTPSPEPPRASPTA